MSDIPPGSVHPPRTWELGTNVLLLTIAGSALLNALAVVLNIALHQWLTSDDEEMPAFLAGIVDNPYPIDGLNLALVIGYIVGFIVWRRRTRTLVARFGADPVSTTRHPGIPTWTVGVLASLCVGRMRREDEVTDVDGAIRLLQIDSTATVLRIIGLAGLAVAIWMIRDRVRATLAAYVAAPAPVFTPPPAFTPPPPPPVTPVRSAAPARDVPGIDDLPFADDDFWHRVRQAGATADLALLETSGPRMHRWLLIPADTDPAAVRENLAPGSAITVFTEPPVSRDTAGYHPPAATEYHGLLESSGTGAVWYQSVTPRRLSGFLDRAKIGGRWALYPVDDPGALTARL
ncbi:hypothetical protein [Actinoplanes subglobosus]|uniref:Uncharacterized protein n=1 Tax=Actinoplanes subglobosus TaxID=1547892 RepID=A0ABV8IU58_9ACTN